MSPGQKCDHAMVLCMAAWGGPPGWMLKHRDVWPRKPAFVLSLTSMCQTCRHFGKSFPSAADKTFTTMSTINGQSWAFIEMAVNGCCHRTLKTKHDGTSEIYEFIPDSEQPIWKKKKITRRSTFILSLCFIEHLFTFPFFNLSNSWESLLINEPTNKQTNIIFPAALLSKALVRNLFFPRQWSPADSSSTFHKQFVPRVNPASNLDTAPFPLSLLGFSCLYTAWSVLDKGCGGRRPRRASLWDG